MNYTKEQISEIISKHAEQRNGINDFKARMKMTEILYIFFGIHTANAVLLADRVEQQAQAKAA